MKTLKFRAWDKISKEMFYSDFHIAANGKILWWESEEGYVRPRDENEIEIMQFTGLTDKNDKEIYDGDIIGEENVYHYYHYVDREGWQPEKGKWTKLETKKENFTGKGEEKYIPGLKLSVVEWKNSSCGFEPFSDSEENYGHCGGGKSPNSFEVIGNIYENPELIK